MENFIKQTVPTHREYRKIAGDARIALEKKTKVKVSTKENYKEIPEHKKKALNNRKK